MIDPPKRIEICRFPGNKRLAVTLSWDDGVIQDRKLVEFMNQNGLKGTFNLNSGTLNQPGRTRNEHKIESSEVASLYAGHEVAIHTVSHPHLPLIDPSQLAYEVLDDRKALEDLVGYPVRGMAYPFGTYNQRVIDQLRSLGIVYCRTVEAVDNCFPPREPLAWAATGHMFAENPLDIGQRFTKLHDNPKANGVYFIWGHSYEFNTPTDRWEEMEKRFKPLAGHADVWYCTNIELFDYQAARERIVIAANKRMAFNPSALTVTLNVDGKLVDVHAGQTVHFNSLS